MARESPGTSTIIVSGRIEDTSVTDLPDSGCFFSAALRVKFHGSVMYVSTLP